MYPSGVFWSLSMSLTDISELFHSINKFEHWKKPLERFTLITDATGKCSLEFLLDLNA